MATERGAPLMQIVGDLGSGSRRMAFHFLSPAKQMVWMSPQWDLYAPTLWKLASDYHVQELIGLECGDRKKWRSILRELLQSNALDALILDRLRLLPAEGFFLQKLCRSSSTRVLVIDSQPHAFCTKRLHISLSHRSFRFFWSKGGSPTPRELPFTFFQEIDRLYDYLRGEVCTL